MGPVSDCGKRFGHHQAARWWLGEQAPRRAHGRRGGTDGADRPRVLEADGLAFVAETSRDWGPSYFAVRNWWHSALYLEHASVFGRSHAERDAIDLTLLAAAAGCSATAGNGTGGALVRALVAERVARKPTAGRAAGLVIEAGRVRAARHGTIRNSGTQRRGAQPNGTRDASMIPNQPASYMTPATVS
jgi:hypothetical protein